MKPTTLVRVVLVLCALPLHPNITPAQAREKIVTRVFWQDRETDKLSWADVVAADRLSIRRGWVAGFPQLDAEKQDLVQMRHCDGVLMVGVRDHDDGKHQSGWVAIDTGVSEEPHGNHTHWKYTRKPAVKRLALDSEQGNPAHIYVYDRHFYLANDTRNGFTRAMPDALMQGKRDAAVFYSGGGNHITMAAVNNAVTYSTWIDGGGPDAGRVDVVSTTRSSPKIVYSFRLPTGVIHGATYNSGKVFFAPADGVCWVNADPNLRKSSETVAVNHISLGKDTESDRPMRTGAFENARNWVLFSTGTADQSALCMIDASAAAPALIKLNIDVADGLKLMTPKSVMSLGRRYAFLFHDRTDPDSDVQEQLTIVELDPNRDRNFRDARVKLTLPVGPSKVEGHHGHHAISFDAYGRHAVFTEPAQGMLNILSLPSMKVVARFKVDGVPDAIVAVGAPEHFH